MAAAKAAQKEWAAVPIAEKARMVHAGLDSIAEHTEEIARWVSAEMGKTIRESREEILTDITVPCGKAIVEDALRFHGRVIQPAQPDRFPGRRVMVIYQPIGVDRVHLALELPGRDDHQLHRVDDGRQHLRVEAERVGAVRAADDGQGVPRRRRIALRRPQPDLRRPRDGRARSSPTTMSG